MSSSTDAYEESLRGAARSESWMALVAAAELGVRSVGAEAVSLGVLDDLDEGQLNQTAVGFDDALALRYARLSASAALPGPAAIRLNRPLFLVDRTTTIEQFPAARPILDGSPYEAAACLPLTSGDRSPVGYLAAHWSAPHNFDALEADQLRSLAAVCCGAALRMRSSNGDEVARLLGQVDGRDVLRETHAQIEQAKGVLMERYELSSQAAWRIIQRLSAGSSTTPPEVAALLVTGEAVAGLTDRFLGDMWSTEPDLDIGR